LPDRGQKTNAAFLANLAVAHARLAHGNRAYAGHDVALRQMAMTHDALMAIFSLEAGMAAEKLGDLGLQRLGQ